MLWCTAPKFPTNGRGLSPVFPAQRSPGPGPVAVSHFGSSSGHHPLPLPIWCCLLADKFAARLWQEDKNGSPSSWFVPTVGARRSFLQGVPNWTNLLIPYSPYGTDHTQAQKLSFSATTALSVHKSFCIAGKSVHSACVKYMTGWG